MAISNQSAQKIDLLFDSADESAKWIEQAGGKVIVPPFDIQIGRCVVLEDPWEILLFYWIQAKAFLKRMPMET